MNPALPAANAAGAAGAPHNGHDKANTPLTAAKSRRDFTRIHTCFYSNATFSPPRNLAPGALHLVRVPTKILPTLVSPVGLAILLCLASVTLQNRRIGRCLIWLACLLLYAASIPITADLILSSLQNRFPPLTPTTCPSADAIVILGGILPTPQREPARLDWNESVERFEQGLALYQAGKAPRIVFTSGGPGDEGEEGQFLTQAALARGVPPQAIEHTRHSPNTEAEAFNTAALAADKGYRAIILVTSAYHMPRAMMLFGRTSLAGRTTPYPADYQTRRDSKYEFQDFFPRAEDMARTERGLREYWGRLFYLVKR